MLAHSGVNIIPGAPLLAGALGIPGVTPALPGVGAGTTQQTTQARKSREIYIGNLCIGTVTPEMLRELFNAALAGLVPDPINEPPVIEVKMDNTGRYSFVELRTEELATTAMTLDKTELCGRQMNIGRPKGYVPGSGAPTVADNKLGLAQQLAAKLAGGVTNVILLEGMLDAAAIRNEEERREVSEMVYEESVRCGKVLGIAVPIPPETVSSGDSCRAYIKFNVSAEATKCKEMMDGRMFDENKVKATYATEAEYNRAAAGEWIVEDAIAAMLGGLPLPPGGFPPPPVQFPQSLTGLPTITL